MKAAAIALLCLPALAGAQVFKCNVNGSTVYQSRPCNTTGGTGQELKMQASPTASPAERPPVRPTGEATPAPPPAPQAQPALPQRSWVDVAADACMEWYRPLLRDPRGAYYRNASHEKDVITIDIFGTNGFGGYATKTAACELKNGAIDDGWTKMHAQRLKWDVR